MALNEDFADIVTRGNRLPSAPPTLHGPGVRGAVAGGRPMESDVRARDDEEGYEDDV